MVSQVNSAWFPCKEVKDTMTNDTEKLSTILPYIRALDEETKRRLDRFRQANGNGTSLVGFGYGELLDKIYEVHARFQQEKQEQCRPLMDRISEIEGKIQGQCVEEIHHLVEKTVSSLKRS